MTDIEPTEGGGETARPPKVRASARIIASLARQPAWVDSMSPEMRAELARKLEASIATCESAREIASVTKAIAALERADIDKARLFLDAEKQGDEESSRDVAVALLADLAEIRRRTLPSEPDAD